jgi:outer membrane lipoprotein-sorting protein
MNALLNSPGCFRRMSAIGSCILLLLAASPPSANAQSPDSAALLTSWLAAQTNIQTWSADFVQTRQLKSLTQPLTASGHVWFEAPNKFRWELTSPARTIAVRQPEQLLVISPKLKRVEKFSLDAKNAGPWKDLLALLDAGFPRSREQVESRFNVLSQTTTNGIHEIALQPKAESARRLMPQITIGFTVNTLALYSTELRFADGSTMKNVFDKAEMNPKIDPMLFNPVIEPDYKVIGSPK